MIHRFGIFEYAIVGICKYYKYIYVYIYQSAQIIPVRWYFLTLSEDHHRNDCYE